MRDQPVETLALGALLAGALLYAAWRLLARPAGRPVYLLDLACFTTPDRLRVGRKELTAKLQGKVDEMQEAPQREALQSTVDFMGRLLESSGLGDGTGMSDAILKMLEPGVVLTEKNSYPEVLAESEMVLYAVVGDLLARTGVKPAEVDVVITSCSCFAPTPSMAAMIVNRFKMRRDVLTYSLAGMGCSSSLITVDLAKHLLQALPSARVLLVNHENISNCWYLGPDRAMILPNCLFRLGGAAVLLTNRRADRGAAKYELLHSVRTHLGADDDAFGCMGNGEDDEGVMGVFLRRNVIQIAGRALKHNLTALAPRVLPYSELARHAWDPTYVPRFSRAFAHFLIHTGGRGVLEEIQRSLGLSDAQLAPSKATLAHFGNTSAASTWYTLASIEHGGGVRRGQRVLQLGFGGGFKANSAVWRARRGIRQRHACWAAALAAAGGAKPQP